MSQLKMIAMLCTLCEEQSKLIRAMAVRLGELGDVAFSDEIAKVDQIYRDSIGDGELP